MDVHQYLSILTWLRLLQLPCTCKGWGELFSCTWSLLFVRFFFASTMMGFLCCLGVGVGRLLLLTGRPGVLDGGVAKDGSLLRRTGCVVHSISSSSHQDFTYYTIIARYGCVECWILLTLTNIIHYWPSLYFTVLCCFYFKLQTKFNLFVFFQAKHDCQTFLKIINIPFHHNI